jgi:hypothetical protein
MKKILLIIFVLTANHAFAQDSLNYVLKGNKFIHKIKPIVGFGFKNQSILESNGYGTFVNVGLTYNKSFKLSYGRENITLNYVSTDLTNTMGNTISVFGIAQNNLGLTYIYKEHRVLHPAFNLKFTNSTYAPYNIGEYVRFKGVKPGIDLQLNLNKLFRFNIGVARNIAYNSPGILEELLLNGNEFSFGIEFSRFKK